jgi:class I lanthipeptide synthase
VTPAAPNPPHARRPRPPRRGDGLYASLDWALVRAPLLAAGAAGGATAGASGGSLLPDDLRVRAAVSVASADLARALERTQPGDRRARRVRGKLLRYLIRMSTRPTPYGLFAGVGLVGWDSETDLALGPEPPRTRTRPDMEWLLDLVASLEHDPDIRSGLRLVASSAVVLRGGRAFSMGGSGAAVSVRATGVVRRALELARVPVAYAALAEELAAAPGATPGKVERLLDELWRQGFLLFDLRPPLTGADPADHVRERLLGNPAGRAVAEGLEELRGLLDAWDRLPLEERSGPWPDLLNRLRVLHPAGGSSNLLQTDMALPLAGRRLHAAVGAEAARAAELLVRLSPYPRGLPRLDAYRHAFEARYGLDREVPLLELLDPDLGLGPPGDHGGGVDHQVAARRHQLLRDLALDAHRHRRLVVELDDELLSRLETWTPEPAAVPPSLDISVFVAASSPAAIDAGNFQVVVGPNLGATSAGRNLGRFADLLGPRAQAALAAVDQAEAALAPGRVLAEVVYLPERARSANVAIRPAVRTREIVIATLPGVPAERVVAVNELVVGIGAGRFRVRWPRGGVEVVGVQGHMLNPLRAPAAARFLLDVAGDGRCQLSSFDWGPAAAFPFLPRVQCGRVVLAVAQWRIDPAARELGVEASDSFAAGLAAWRARWSVPGHVYLAVGDNRLLLTLDDPEHVELLREELRGLPDGRSALLQEALPGLAEAWLPAADGGHITELVVPVAARQPAASAPATGPAIVRDGPVPARVRLRLPGSDWLYLKLYGPRPFEDELIAGPLRSFTQFATSAGLSDGWYFLRYSDPEPHLRIRFHGEPAALLGPLLQQLCDWAGDLVADGACTRFSFATYEREVERYGGEAGMRAAEAVFTADSPAVADILHLSRDGRCPYDLTTLAVLSIDDLLEGVGLGSEERAAVYRDAAELSPHGGAEYRRRQRALRELLGRPGTLTESPEGNVLAGLLAARRAALTPTAALLGSLERDNLLQRPLAQLHRSFVHLHANRLLGTDPLPEQVALQLLRRTREGLRRAPVA